MTEIFQAWLMAVRDCFSRRMLWVSLWPAIVCAILLGIAGWTVGEHVVIWLRTMIQGYDLPTWLTTLGEWLVPLFLMWLLLPLLVVGALVVANFTVTPTALAHIEQYRFQRLMRLGENQFFDGSIWLTKHALAAFAIWVLTLPTLLLPPVAFVCHLMLWGWLSYRVLSWDMLSQHASKAELAIVLQRQQKPLLFMGLIIGLSTSVPMLLWFISPLALLLAPLVAFVSIWLQLQLISFFSLWFGHFCLNALNDLRHEPIEMSPPEEQTWALSKLD